MENKIENEVWRDIDGYDGVYQVSNLGRVRSRKSGEWKLLKAYRINSGYLMVCLCKDKTQKSALIHRLVASAFVANDNILKTEVNHIDENKVNNIASNLEWCTSQYNKKYNELNLRKKNNKRHKLKDLYDPKLSIKQNIEIFMANGIECCELTVNRLRRDLKLERPQPVRDKIKSLYDPNQSIAQNIKLLKEKGVDCSRNTIIRLRKDLGLINK